MMVTVKYLIPLALGIATFEFDSHHGVQVEGFAPSCVARSKLVTTGSIQRGSPLWYVSTDLPDLSEMKASEMKKELESYGVSTKSLFDKTEFEKALSAERLRQETRGAQTLKDRINLGTDSTSANKKERKTTWGKPRTDPTQNRKKWSENAMQSNSNDTREQKYDNAFQEGIAMKLSELKQELKDRGISTSAFFEKVEMAKAYAEAVADNVKKWTTPENAGPTDTSSRQSSPRGEPFDPSYRDVNVEPFNARLTFLPGETVIDITEFVKGTAATGGVWQ